jgi:pyrroline-5-carboxylate reductase
MNILIIGGGNMGLTYAKAFINSHVVTAEHLMILEQPNSEKINELKSLNLATIITDYKLIAKAELIILAVKPQDAPGLFKQIEGFIEADQVVLSIMAGITINTIQKALKIEKIIRAMPNLPAQIGHGMTAFTCTDAISRLEEQWVQNLLQTTGKTLNVPNEILIDAVTAISGSGPAYIYYFMDAMIQSAIKMGIKSVEAEMLVKQTFSGALHLYRQSSYNCEEWIQKVASKGGTTEAAVKHFNENDLNNIIIGGANAAFKRAQELGK